MVDGGIERTALTEDGRWLQVDSPACGARGYPSRLARRIAKGLDIRVCANLNPTGRRPSVPGGDLSYLPFGRRQHRAVAAGLGRHERDGLAADAPPVESACSQPECRAR